MSQLLGGQSVAPDRITFLVDVDNTLLDNDAAKAAMDHQMRALLGPAETERFWVIYEAVRKEQGYVGVPLALAEFLRTRSPDLDPAASREQHFALADILFGQPYANFVYPGAREALAHLATLGRVAILSEGDPAYQATKIARAGLAESAGGYVIVCPNKTTYFAQVAAIVPGDLMVLIEDKPDNIARARPIFARLGIPFSGIFVRQGKYAATVPAEPWPGAEITVNTIADLIELTRDDLLPKPVSELQW
jgi:hypothetical protein